METGKKNNGYTLLEILAVITLIGLMAIIVYPNFTLGDERTMANYIGNLLGSDLKSLKEEAMCTQSELTVIFSKQGYQFKLGETPIVRNFNQFQFGFIIPEPDKEESESAATNIDTGSGEGGDLSSQEQVTTPMIKFSKDGAAAAMTLPWATRHFSGTMAVDANGVLKWTFTQKK